MRSAFWAAVLVVAAANGFAQRGGHAGGHAALSSGGRASTGRAAAPPVSHGFGYRRFGGPFAAAPPLGVGAPRFFYTPGYFRHPFFGPRFGFGFGLGYGGFGYGGFGYDGYGYGLFGPPPYLMESIPLWAPPPTYFGPDYYPPPTGGVESRGEPPLYLIAMRDHSIRAVLSYWVEGSSLFFIDMDHAEHDVPLKDVDRELSERLNAERHVAFHLPPPPDSF